MSLEKRNPEAICNEQKKRKKKNLQEKKLYSQCFEKAKNEINKKHAKFQFVWKKHSL